MKQPVFWHQGLFLQPQHLQQHDQWVNGLNEPIYDYFIPHSWGVGSITINESLLTAGIFSLEKGTFIFQDHTCIDITQNSLVDATSFDEQWVERNKPLAVFIGLRKLDSHRYNTTSALNDTSSERDTRFTESGREDVEDIYSGGQPANVATMQYNLKIFFSHDTEEKDGYFLIQIALLEQSGGEITLSENFIPPSLAINSSKKLHGIISEVNNQMASRGNNLEAYRREKGVHNSEFGTREMVYLLALRSLNRYYPLLNHYLRTAQTHPWNCYSLLLQIIGELSSFSENVSALGQFSDSNKQVSEYNHKNLFECFSSAIYTIKYLLNNITAGPDSVVPLNFDGTYYYADLKNVSLDRWNEYYFVVDIGKAENMEMVGKSISGMAKLSSKENMPTLHSNSLPGVRLEQLATPPRELPKKVASLYFKIDSHSDKWQELEKEKNMALYLDENQISNCSVSLMIIKRS